MDLLVHGSFLFGLVMAKYQQCDIQDNHKNDQEIEQGHSNFFPVLRTLSLLIEQRNKEKPYRLHCLLC